MLVPGFGTQTDFPLRLALSADELYIDLAHALEAPSARSQKIACMRMAVFFYYYSLHQINTTRNIQM